MSLRLYSFVNYYLSSIQQGVQTGHAAVDLVRKYNAPPGTRSHIGHNSDMVRNWADNHKTFIILNGGNNESLAEIYDAAKQSGYPFISFREDEQSLGGIMTCVAVVLPESVYDTKFSTETGEYVHATLGKISPEDHRYDLTSFVKNSRLAS